MGFFIFMQSVFAGSFYSDIYKTVKESPGENARDRVSVQLGISKSTLKEIVNKTISSGELAGLCGSLMGLRVSEMTQADLLVCADEISKLYDFELEIAKLENTQSQKALATEIWSNGTLADSEFDLVVDLNLIDVLFFSSTAAIPNARVYNLFDGEKDDHGYYDDNYETDEDYADLEADEMETENVNVADSNVDDSERRMSVAKKAKEESLVEKLMGVDEQKFVAYENVCSAPDQLLLTSETLEMLEKDSKEIEQEVGDGSSSPKRKIYNRKEDWTAQSSNYKGGNYPTFADVSSGSGSGSGSGSKVNWGSGVGCQGEAFSMFGGDFCIPKFCNENICVDVELIKDIKKRETKENCIECLVDFAAKNIKEAYDQKERLNPCQNTSVHFNIRCSHLPMPRFNFNIFGKAPTATNAETSDQKKTVTEEVREIQKDFFIATDSDGVPTTTTVSAAGIGDDNTKIMSNRAILDMLIKDCADVTALIPEGDSKDMIKMCRENMEKQGGIMIFENAQYKQSLRAILKSKGQNELRGQYFKEMNQQFTALSSEIETIAKLLAQMISAKEIDKKAQDCKTSQ